MNGAVKTRNEFQSETARESANSERWMQMISTGK